MKNKLQKSALPQIINIHILPTQIMKLYNED